MNQAILLVEDEEHDVIFMQLAFERAKVTNPLAVATEGQEAIGYLSGEGKFGNRQQYPLPGLVLLDLRLPQVPGLEVLKWIRQQPTLAHLPVMILSSSDQDSDVEAAYQLGASAYLVKPSSPSELVEIVRRLKKYWLDSTAPPADCKEWLDVTVPRPATRSSLA